MIWRMILPTTEGTIYGLYNLTTRYDVTGNMPGYGLLLLPQQVHQLLMTHWYPTICVSDRVYFKKSGELMVAEIDCS